MKQRTDRIAALLEKSLRGELSPEENRELEAWLSEEIENSALSAQLSDQDQLLERLRIQDLANTGAMWQKTMSRINPGATVVEMPRKKLTWARYVAAAAIVLAVSGVVYFLNQKPANDTVAKTEQQDQSEPVKSDEIVPGGKYAKLTLADGSSIEMVKSPDGILTKQGGLSLSKTDGHLSYSGRFITSGPVSTGAEKHASLHNMVSTPRGGQYQITLPDGSRVWLNAASSLRFPLAFAGNQRIVEVTGEAYFEVARVFMPGSTSVRMPFIVRVTRSGVPHDVEVLGTHFNVNAYEEEKVIKTTLLEGSVRVKHGDNAKTIEPGQQAVSQDGEIKIRKTDTDKAIAWKEGFFGAEGSLRTVMNQVARWYDVEVVFEGVNADTIDPKEVIDLSVPLASSFDVVRESLESQKVHLRIEKRKVFVMP
jgi:transmembrane sensor